MLYKKKFFRYGFLLVILLLISLVAGSYSNLMKARFGIYGFDPTLRNFKIILASTYDASVIVANAFGGVFENANISEQTSLKDLRLTVEPGAIKTMASNLPESAKKSYYNGKLLYPDGMWKKISFRFRGRNIWHWDPNKPSLRVKLSKDNPINLQEHINFVNPEDRTMIANYYSELLAEKIGVLAHKTELVRLFINNAYYGVYQMTTREDENMLRLNGRVPGPIYVGDHLEEIWQAEQFELNGDLDSLKYVNPMAEAVDAMYAPRTIESYEKLWRNLDKEKTARWVALLNISGGIHTNFRHNHAYYFDPSAGKLEPLTSDILGLGAMLYPRGTDRIFEKNLPVVEVPINEKMNPLINVVLRDPYFYDLRNRVLYEALTGYASTESQSDLLKDIYALIDPEVKADRKKSYISALFSGWNRVPYSNWQYDNAKEEVFNWVRDRNDYLLSELDKSNVNIHTHKLENNKVVALISVAGHSAADFNLSTLPDGTVSADKTLNGLFSEVSQKRLRLYPGLKEDKDFYYKLTTSRNRIPDFSLTPSQQSYLFEFSGMKENEISLFLNESFINSVTGSKILPNINKVDKIIPEEINYSSASIHPWSFKEKILKDIVLGPGVVDINETIISNVGQGINIIPGTQINLSPGISIISKGPLKIIGTADEPILFRRLDSKKPWGVLAALGNKSTGSIIKFSDIKGGSLSINENIQYSGMVSFHHSNDVLIESSKIHGNVISDDTLHVIGGSADIKSTLIADCFGDCVDFDYVKVNIENLQLVNAGNDGLDFMTSEAIVKNSSIEGFGDKGVSGGEGSVIALNNVNIFDGYIGVASKDSTLLSLTKSSISNTEFGIDVYRKNWRYGGSGNVSVSDNSWSNNKIDVRVADGGNVNIISGQQPNNIINN